MRDKPILFNGDMVRAILDGRKTQTRRVLKNHIHRDTTYFQRFEGTNWDCCRYDGLRLDTHKCPYGQIGDVLWVRETWGKFDKDHVIDTEYYYAADTRKGSDSDQIRIEMGYKYKPSIHMPKEACRIKLEITDIRVERLNDISEEDANAEGCNLDWYDDNAGSEDLWPCARCNGYRVHGTAVENMGWTEVDCELCNTSKKMFQQLWKSINGEGSWNENPWVWVIEFNRIK